MGCKRIRGIAHTDTLLDNKQAFSRVRCKQWICGYCARVNRSQWRAVLTKYLRDDERIWSFMTVTLPDYIRDNNAEGMERTKASARFIRDNWNALLTAIKRQYGACEFVRVIEQHKDGALHLHILISLESDAQRKLRNPDDENTEYWYSETLHRVLCPVTKTGKGKRTKKRKSWGYVHDWRNIETKHKSIMYVTKYMTKRESEFESLAKTEKLRVIQTSRGIKFQTESSPHEWKIRHVLMVEDLKFFTWHDLNENRDISVDDMKPYYPLPEDYGD